MVLPLARKVAAAVRQRRLLRAEAALGEIIRGALNRAGVDAADAARLALSDEAAAALAAIPDTAQLRNDDAMAPTSLSDRVRAGAFAPEDHRDGRALCRRGAARFRGCFVRPTARLVIRAKGRGEPVGYSRRRRRVGRTERRDLISHLIKQVEQVLRTRVFSNNEDWFAELRCRNTRGGVIDHELDRVAAAPYVAAKVTGDMDRDTAGLGEKMAERRLGGAKGDRRQSSAVERIG